MRRGHAAVTAALSFVLSVPALVGCSASPGSASTSANVSNTNAAASNASPAEQLANPWVDCDTIGDVESHAGFAFSVPESLDGYGAATFQAVDGETAQATYGDASDASAPVACVRKSTGAGQDVSGDYNDYPDSGTVEVGGTEVSLRGTDGSWSVATWDEGDFSFAIVLTDGRDDGWMASMVASVS